MAIDKQSIAYQALLLGGFATIAPLLLVLGNLLTHDKILDNHKKDLLDSLNQVVAAELYDNDLLAQPLQIDGTTIYRGTKEGQVTALAWQIMTQEGYAGEIQALLALTPQGEILGVRVLSHSETPNLGDKIEIAKSDWVLSFNGLSLGNPDIDQWKVKKDGGQFDSFTGATITPRAVVKAVKQGLLFFEKYRGQLMYLEKTQGATS